MRLRGEPVVPFCLCCGGGGVSKGLPGRTAALREVDPLRAGVWSGEHAPAKSAGAPSSQVLLCETEHPV